MKQSDVEKKKSFPINLFGLNAHNTKTELKGTLDWNHLTFVQDVISNLWGVIYDIFNLTYIL